MHKAWLQAVASVTHAVLQCGRDIVSGWTEEYDFRPVVREPYSWLSAETQHTT